MSAVFEPEPLKDGKASVTWIGEEFFLNNEIFSCSLVSFVVKKLSPTDALRWMVQVLTASREIGQ